MYIIGTNAHAYCDNCKAIKPITVQPVGVDVTGKFTGSDVVCNECAWIVAVFSTPIS